MFRMIRIKRDDLDLGCGGQRCDIFLIDQAAMDAGNKRRVEKMQQLCRGSKIRTWSCHVRDIGIDQTATALRQKDSAARCVVFKRSLFKIKKLHGRMPVPWAEVSRMFCDIGTGRNIREF